MAKVAKDGQGKTLYIALSYRAAAEGITEFSANSSSKRP